MGKLEGSGLPPGRLASIDAFRGFTMLAMASAGLSLAPWLEHHGKSWLAYHFDHAKWEGCTAWDLIQPAFLFLVGVSMPFSFAKRQSEGASPGQLTRHAVRRCLLLALIGIFLDTYAERTVTIQFIRVLQQIALAYLPAFLLLAARPIWQGLAIVAILALHSGLFWLFAHGHSLISPWLMDNNLGSAIDAFFYLPRLDSYGINFMPPSMYHYATLNALPSCATILLGVLGGELLQTNTPMLFKLTALAVAGGVCMGLGWFPEPYVPMIKRLWTSSFTLYSGGWTFLLMAAFFLIVDVLPLQKLAWPLAIVGMNSIAIYVFSSLLGSECKQAAEPFVRAFLKPWGFYSHLTEMEQKQILAIAVAIAALFIKWLFCFWLYRRRIFFKV